MANAYLQSKLKERWRQHRPDNVWASRKQGAHPPEYYQAWDTFDDAEAEQLASASVSGSGKPWRAASCLMQLRHRAAY